MFKTEFALPFPDWCTEEVLKKLRDSRALMFDLFLCTDSLKKMAGGPLVKVFITNVNESESKDNVGKIQLFSAHYFNVLAFLRAHGLTEPRLVDYGCAAACNSRKTPWQR